MNAPQPAWVWATTALVALTFSGCTAAPVEFEGAPSGPSTHGSATIALDGTNHAVLRIQASLPGPGNWVNVTASLRTDPNGPSADAIARFSGFLSPAADDPLSYLATIDHRGRPGAGESTVQIGGTAVRLETAPVDAAFGIFTSDGGGYRDSRSWLQVQPGDDLRERYGLAADDPLFHEFVLVIVPQAGSHLTVAADIRWDGVPLSIALAPLSDVRSVRPSEMESLAAASTVAAYGAVDASADVLLGAGPGPSIAFFTPSLNVVGAEGTTNVGSAYVEPAGEDRQVLEAGRLGSVHWVENVGTWRFGMERALQLDRWDQPALLVVQVPPPPSNGAALSGDPAETPIPRLRLPAPVR